jgi:hypothetical protein
MAKNDNEVIAAMGSRFEQFRALAALAYNNPSKRRYAEAEMAKILATMTPEERVTLRQALVKAGVR